MPEWSSLQDIDVSMSSRASSTKPLLTPSSNLPPTRALEPLLFLLPSRTPETGSMFSPPPPSASTSWTKNSNPVSSTGLASRSSRRVKVALCVRLPQTPSAIIMLAAEAMGTVFSIITPFEMHCFQEHKQLLAPQKELPSLIPSSQSRPADIFLPNWERGRPAAPDVSVISTMQQLTQRGAASNQGYALSIGEGRKMALHVAPCQAVGVLFVPLIVETLGGWSGLAVSSVSRIGRILGQRLGIPPPESSRHLFQGCAICVWRGPFG